MEDTPRSKALHSTLVTSPSMHCSTLNSVQGYSSQDSIRRGFSIDGKGVSMEQVYGRFQSHNPPGALSAYLASDQLDVNLPNSLSRHSTLQRANSSFMAPLQENQPSDLIQQNFPLTGAKAVVDPDRVAQLYRYRLKKINRLKAYAQDSLQEKKVRQSSRQNRIKGNSGRLGSRDDESAMTAGTGTGTPDGSSENKEREANGEEDTSRIRHEINMIHLGFAGEVGGLSGQITDRELHDLGMSLVGPLSSAGGLGLPPPFSWPESNMIPEETPMGSSPPLVLKPSEATGLLMPEVEDKAHHLPHDTTDLLDAILSDNFNPSDLLL